MFQSHNAPGKKKIQQNTAKPQILVKYRLYAYTNRFYAT